MKSITLETYYEWIRVAAYFVWVDESSETDSAFDNWVEGTNEINQKLRREGISVEGRQSKPV